jgi:hypothetical protein
MAGGNQFEDDAGNHDTEAPPGLARPNDARGKRFNEITDSAGKASRQTVDDTPDPAVSAARRPFVAGQREQQHREQRQAAGAADDQPVANVAGGVGKHGKGHGNRNETGKDHAVDEAVDGDGGQHGAHLQVLESGDQPGPHDRTDAQGDQQVGEIAGHDRAEQAERADRPNGMQQLSPLPRPHGLLGGDRKRDQ